MSHPNYISKSNIFFSCTEKMHRSVEHHVPEHVLVYVYAGRMSITDPQGSYLVQEGEAMLLYRNMLAKFVKHPGHQTPFKSVSIAFDRTFLQKFYSDHHPSDSYKAPWCVQPVKKDPLLISLFDSILPYYDIHGDNLPAVLTELKLSEAMTILRIVHPDIDSVLSNFGGNGKIDLVDFMQKNYSFNIPIERFAYLTGRSLATFKRDFQKTFQMSPQKWLLDIRLKNAHYMITQKGKKPSEVYLEVGFENLSHFSRVFKERFGVTPSAARMNCQAQSV